MKLTFAEFDRYMQPLIHHWNYCDTLSEHLSEKTMEEIYLLQSAYITMLESFVGDNESQWISYFLYDCNCGKKEMKVTVEDEVYIMRNTKDLYDMISRF